MTFSELRAKARESVENHLSPARWDTEANLRIAIAFAPFLFVLLGIALGVQFKKNSRSIGVGLSLIIIVLYYGLFLFFTSLASQGAFSPLLLTWCPNLIILAAGIFLWRRMARQ